MKKIAYTLGLTLLCSLPAIAQENASAAAPQNVQQKAEDNAPIDSAAAAAISEAVDNIISEQPQADSPIAEEEQTIFFSDDLLDEVDEELKAPIFAADEQTEPQQAAPATVKAPAVPEIKIPENIKTPEAKTTPAAAVKGEQQPVAASPSAPAKVEAIEVDEDFLGLSEEVPEVKAVPAAAPAAEKPATSEAPVLMPAAPQNAENKAAVEAPQASESIPVAHEEPAQKVNDEPLPASQTVPTENVQESAEPEAVKAVEPTTADTSKEVIVEISTEEVVIPAEQPQAEKAAPAPEAKPEPAATPVVSSEPEAITPPAPKVQAAPQPEPEPVADQKPEIKTAPKAFSLDEKAFPAVPKKNAYTLDTNAPLPANILKNDALSPSILNRGIVNISPEQRAKMMMKKKYDEMDTNQDGVVSEEEFVEYKTKEARKIAHQVFKQIDKNGDKTLSEYEYGILMNKMIENYIKQPKPKAR